MAGNLLQVINKLREVNLLEPTNGPNGASNLLQLANSLSPTAAPTGDFLVQEDGTSLFTLEDGSGFILLEV